MAIKRAKIARSDDEPDAICANCDSWLNTETGRRCARTYCLTASDDHCVKFFPDPLRWPDADHG